MPLMKFIQFADVHLDSSVGGAANLSGEKKAILRQDIRTAFERACNLAAEHKADILLIPGDLFDYESLQSDTAKYLIDAFQSIAPVRVFITPGNHDSLMPRNPYASNWPDNVHIFKSSEFETIELHDLNCAITGIAHAHKGITDRAISQPIPKIDAMTNILIFHGSRDGYKPSQKETVIPFSDFELINQGFDYAAIGHYHSIAQIIDESGAIKGAYSGCLQGRGLDEMGEKFAIIGEIDSRGRVTLDKCEVAPRRIIGTDVDITGASDNAAIIGRIESAISESGARACDLVNINLYGALSSVIRIDTSHIEASDKYFYININHSRILPDYDLDLIAIDSAASSLRSAFVRRMLEMESQADADQQRVIRDGIYYGLAAMDGRKPEPRDAS